MNELNVILFLFNPKQTTKKKTWLVNLFTKLIYYQVDSTHSLHLQQRTPAHSFRKTEEEEERTQKEEGGGGGREDQPHLMLFPRHQKQNLLGG